MAEIRPVPEYPMLPKPGNATPSGLAQHQGFLTSTLTRVFGEYGFAVNRLIKRTRFGTLANRPSASEADRFYYATDTNELYYDDGSAWHLVASADVINGQFDPEHATNSGTDTYVSATNTTVPGDGVTITRDFQSANTTTTPTLDAKTITDRDGNALWAGAINGVHELQYASGTDTYLLLDPRPTAANVNNAPVARDSSGNVKGADPSAAQDFVTKSYADSGPATSSDPALAFDTWRTPNANRPTFVETRIRAQTNGSLSGDVQILVDESGGTTSDYILRGVFADASGGSGFDSQEHAGFIVPAGGSYQIFNNADPNSVNSIEEHREFTLWH